MHEHVSYLNYYVQVHKLLKRKIMVLHQNKIMLSHDDENCNVICEKQIRTVWSAPLLFTA